MRMNVAAAVRTESLVVIRTNTPLVPQLEVSQRFTAKKRKVPFGIRGLAPLKVIPFRWKRWGSVECCSLFGITRTLTQVAVFGMRIRTT